jgi:hypothetical protein
MIVAVAALSNQGIEWAQALAVWTRGGITNIRMAMSVIKSVCIVALLLGTYAVNKDMFVFIKSVAAERMRIRWFTAFRADTYPKMKVEVEVALLDTTWGSVKQLQELWYHGPDPLSSHQAIREARHDDVWQELIDRHSITPGWMLDIPSIAHWATRVENYLNDHKRTHGSAAIVSK